MATKTTTRGRAAPRRRPSREASRAIVDAILDAAARLIERDGIDGLTTNAIARVAGVSVGSLYRYFPDKLSIAAALARRFQEAGTTYALRHFDELVDVELRRVGWDVISRMSSPAFGALSVRRALLREIPLEWMAEARRQTRAVYEAAYAALFAGRAAELRPAPVLDLAFVAYHAVDAAMEAVILHRPDELATLPVRRELFHLGYRYVARDGAILSPPEEPRDDPPRSEGEIDEGLGVRFSREPSRRREAVIEERGPRATRRAILDAAARLLVQGGSRLVTARGVAREAGLAPGALYRHFPNTASVVAQLALDHELEVRAAMVEGMARVGALRGRDAAEALVRVYTSRERGDPALRRALRSSVPLRWAEHASLETQAFARRTMARGFAERTGEIRDGDHELMAFLACRAVEGVLAATIASDRPLEPMVQEMTELVWRYLRAP